MIDNAATIAKMKDAGLSAETILVALGCIVLCAPAVERNGAARRQAAYRERGGGKIPHELRMAVFERDDYTCVYCGSNDDLCADHEVPLMKGGPTEIDNLVTACRRCNGLKKDRDRKAFERELKSGKFRGNPRKSEEIQVKERSPTPPKENTLTGINITPPVPPSENQGFDAFWSEYPKRDGNADKKAALKAFGPAVKRAGGLEPILSGARAYAAHCREKGKIGTEYVKQARSWLNGDLWLEWQPKAPEQVETVSNGKTWVKYGGDLWDHCNAGYTKDHGKSAPTDTRGGWYFDAKYLPTEYPQEQAA